MGKKQKKKKVDKEHFGEFLAYWIPEMIVFPVRIIIWLLRG
ncbi:hypothetical protein [Sediminibacillus albus]|nr:hypothetical protein [Sediminibacillus albus]